MRNIHVVCNQSDITVRRSNKNYLVLSTDGNKGGKQRKKTNSKSMYENTRDEEEREPLRPLTRHFDELFDDLHALDEVVFAADGSDHPEHLTVHQL